MRRYLVVAHQTSRSPELLDALRERLSAGACTFHLVVPEFHGSGFTWDEGRVKAEARHRLEEARRWYLQEGLPVTGEVGPPSPVEAVAGVLRREGADAFAEVIVSTLPLGASRWLRMDAPTRIHRSTGLPVAHVVAHPVPA